MTKNEIKSIPVNELEVGKAYNVARRTNAQGQPVVGTRREDWRAVLITTENLASYASGEHGTYYFQPIKDRFTPRLLAAGWTRFSRSRGECGMAIVTKGALEGLSCAKPAMWVHMEHENGWPMCAQHASLSK